MHTYTDIYIYIIIYHYVIYTRYDMILCCKLVEYIESRPVDIKCCLVASRNTAKLWATHGYTHVIAKLSDQTPVLATASIEAMHAVGLQNTYEQKRSDGSRQQ